jgi:thioredoxin reductase (NADPH)
MKAENVTFLFNSRVKELHADKKLNKITIESTLRENDETLELDGLFISIGRSPSTELFRGQLELDEAGYIIADETTKTNVDGVFAVGDVRTKTVRQIVTAAADGAVAAHFAEEYIANLNLGE